MKVIHSQEAIPPLQKGYWLRQHAERPLWNRSHACATKQSKYVSRVNMAVKIVKATLKQFLEKLGLITQLEQGLLLMPRKMREN